MPVYGNKDILLELQGALLFTGNAEQDSPGHAFFGASNDPLSPDSGGSPPDQHQTGSKTAWTGKCDPLTAKNQGTGKIIVEWVNSLR